MHILDFLNTVYFWSGFFLTIILGTAILFHRAANKTKRERKKKGDGKN
jgi:hypothetical protein